MYILGIETSCDESSAAIIQIKQNKIKVLSNIVSSQIDIHKKYGGIIPELAAREHLKNIIPIIDQAFNAAKISPRQIHAIGVTSGPGLITSLIAGVETAKTLAYTWQKPLISINHIEGHIYANLINQNLLNFQKYFPSLALTISGGHTALVLISDHGKYQLIGETRDDACGEAFDKAARLLGLGYPGGPEISNYAEIFRKKIKSKKNKIKIKLPSPMLQTPNFDFSFSGLKTALLYEIQRDQKYKTRIDEYAYAFEEAIIRVLIAKSLRAAQKYQVNSIMLTGGVSANHALRKQLKQAIDKENKEIKFLMPDLVYTTDNASMIAVATYFKMGRQEFTPWQKIKANPNQKLV